MSTSILVALVFIAMQTFSGWYVWTLVRCRRASLSESLGMGLGLGTAAAALSGIVLWDFLGVWGWCAPTVIAVITAVVIRVRTGSFFCGSDSRVDPGRRLAAIVAIALGLVLGAISLFVNLANYPLKWSGTLSTYHPDMLFFEALSTSLARYGPNYSIFMAGADLRYHWLVYAWSGQLAESAGTEAFVVLTRILPVVAILGSILIAVGWTQRLTRNPWAPSIAVALVISGGYVGATYGTILNFDSPSQQLATVWLLGLSLALWQTTKASASRRPVFFLLLLVIVGVLAAATTLGKISTGLVALAAWALVAVVALARKELWARRSWWALLVAGLASVWVYFDFIAGSAEGGGLGLGSLLNKASSVQGLNPTNTWWGIIAGTGLLLLAMSARWFGLVWFGASRKSRWKPITIYGVGLVLASVMTVVLISGGLNETWFALAASAPLAVLSAAGVGRALSATSLTREWVPSPAAIVAVLVGMVLSGLVIFLWSYGPGAEVFLRWLAPLVGFAGALVAAIFIARMSGLSSSRNARVLAVMSLIVIITAGGSRVLGIGASGFGVQPDEGLRPTEFRPVMTFLVAQDLTPIAQWSEDQAAAGEWLESQSSLTDLVATNITFSPLVPGLAGRQTLISGISYQAPYGRESLLGDVLDRERISLDFINSPSAQTFGPLCSVGVDWLWVDRARTAISDWAPFAEVAQDFGDTLILRTNPTAC
jgi:hypothetical protein